MAENVTWHEACMSTCIMVTDNKADRTVEKTKVGRKPTITPEIADRLVEGFARGYPTGIVLALNKIDDVIFCRAMKNLEFRRRIEEARASALQPAIDTVMAARNTQAGAQWLLERRASEEFGSKNRLQVEEKKPAKVILKHYKIKRK